MYSFRKLFLIIFFFVVACLVVISVVSNVVHARPLTLTFAWQQPMSPGLKGWNLYMSGASGEYQGEPILSVSYDGNPQNEYTSQTDIFSPDAETHIYYFVLTAFDDAEPDSNESGYSNEVSRVIDFEAPGVPFYLTVEIKPFP